MRLFIASRLSIESRRHLSAETRHLVRRSGGLLRAIPDDSEHLTHVFLGDREQTVDQLRSALGPIERQASLRLLIAEARVFSMRKRPRLVCLDVLENGEQVAALSETIRRNLLSLLPDLIDYRIKRPHVTLARFSRRARRQDVTAVEDLLAESGLAGWSCRETVETVELIRSELDHRGARYETLETIPLRRSPALR